MSRKGAPPFASRGMYDVLGDDDDVEEVEEEEVEEDIPQPCVSNGLQYEICGADSIESKPLHRHRNLLP